jgi:hypothetical protein
MKWIAAVTVMLSAVAAAAGAPPQPAGAATTAAVYAGMPITQGSALCTLGYADNYTGLGYAAGHCRESMIVTNEAGDVIGTVVKGMSIVGDTADDYTIEVIRLRPSVAVVNDPHVKAYGPIMAYTGIKPRPGMTVCHDGATTGHSCGQIKTVYTGSFSMTPGPAGDLVSAPGDSGGPVYALLPGTPGRVLVGIFAGKRGNLFMAISWPEIQAISA